MTKQFSRGMCSNGNLRYLGWYRAGLATGVSWRSVRGQGWLVGRLDTAGRFTGGQVQKWAGSRVGNVYSGTLSQI